MNWDLLPTYRLKRLSACFYIWLKWIWMNVRDDDVDVWRKTSGYYVFQGGGGAPARELWCHGWLWRSCVGHLDFSCKMLWIWLFVLGLKITCARLRLPLPSSLVISQLVGAGAGQKYLLWRHSWPMNLAGCAVGLSYLERWSNRIHHQTFVAPSWEAESSTTSSKGLSWVTTSPISCPNVLLLHFLSPAEHTAAYDPYYWYPGCRDGSWSNALLFYYSRTISSLRLVNAYNTTFTCYRRTLDSQHRSRADELALYTVFEMLSPSSTFSSWALKTRHTWPAPPPHLAQSVSRRASVHLCSQSPEEACFSFACPPIPSFSAFSVAYAINFNNISKLDLSSYKPQ